MCFISSGKAAAQPQQAPPPPAPQPLPQPADPNPSATQDQKRLQIAAMKRGFASTIKTSTQGITGNGPDLNTPSAAGLYGNKTTVGA